MSIKYSNKIKMKKFNIVIASLFFSVTALCQHKQEVMQLSMPKGANKLNEVQLKKLSHSEFDDNMAANFHDHIYKKNNLLIYYLFTGVSGPKFKRSLEYSQEIMVALLSGHSELKSTVYIVDTAKIIVVNNIRFAILKYHHNDISYIKFTSDYDKNLEFINGFIEYKREDEAEAQQYLHDFL